ncbi:MAG: Ig-like domain-containing protein [Firmicutes bacterium]|nr:Ig-like domain-containing protein [Bacillota bacterium]
MEIRKPTFKNTETAESIYKEYSSLSPKNHLEAAYIADRQRRESGDKGNDKGSDPGEYRFDKILARKGECHGDPNRGGNDDGDALMTRGRSLYMFTHKPEFAGFVGTPSYCQPFEEKDALYEIRFYVDESELSPCEIKSLRVNAPSHWHGKYEAENIYIKLDKFITEQNCAVTLMTLENRGKRAVNLTLSASSPFASRPWEIYPGNEKQGELRGRIEERDGLTVLYPRLTMTGCREERGVLKFSAALDAGEKKDASVLFVMCADELPEAETDYERYVSLSKKSNSAALEAQRGEYNEYWHMTVPYIDVPDAAVKKAIDYRFWLERYNVLDANIPGYDYQYPVTIEGVLGYNNAIALTQCMHIEDTKWQRTPRLPYGQLLSAAAVSGGSAFLDNPGCRRCWNNHYGQYIADAGKNAFYVHGGSPELAKSLARAFEGDALGQLAHYGNHVSDSTPEMKVISYGSVYMTGNDADTVSMHYRGAGRFMAHAENAYVYGAAKAAADLYALSGEDKKAGEMNSLAEEIKSDILEYLWCRKCKKFETRTVEPREDFVVHNENQPNLIPYKESNGYNYFYMGIPPADEEHLEAFRFLADPEEFPIFPYYTASQRDNKMLPGSNNFSNINFTVQAHAYEAALRKYDRGHKYITPEMLASMTEWCAWNMYPDGGDVRYPNNSEFFNADRASDPCGKGDYYRSWIYHNILGNYIYIFIEDMAGLRPRADGKIELSPIDFGYSHFTADNMRYHGADVSIIYNSDAAYKDIPEGYSLYINGRRALTLKTLSDAVYDPETGEVKTSAEVLFSAAVGRLPKALECMDFDEKTKAILSHAGLEAHENLALGARVTASYTPSAAREAPWAEKHRADGHDPTSKAVNEYPPTEVAVTDGNYVCMPFWGNDGSENEYDTLTLTLDKPVKFDTLIAHYYDDRQEGGYSYPRRCLIEYLDGDVWRPVTTRSQEPRYMTAGRNVSRFDAVTAHSVRVHLYNRRGHFTAVTEIGLYLEDTPRRAVMNHAPRVYNLSYPLKGQGLKARLWVDVLDDGMPFDRELKCHWTAGHRLHEAGAVFADPDSPDTILTVAKAGDYSATLHITDGEISCHCDVNIRIEESDTETADFAPDADVRVDFCSDWENYRGVTDRKNEPVSSSMGAGIGWGTWGSRESIHSLTLTWKSPVTLSRSLIYWYADGGGIRLPKSFDILYLRGKEYIPVNRTSDFGTLISPDKYNEASFSPVVTTSVRFDVECGEGAVGIYRIKMLPPEIAMLPTLSAAVAVGEQPALPDKVTAYADDGTPIELSVVWFGGADTSKDGTSSISGVTEPISEKLALTLYVRADMKKAMATSAEGAVITVRRGGDVYLPKFAVVHYNNGAVDSLTHKIIWNEDTKSKIKGADAGKLTIPDAGEVEGCGVRISLEANII